MLVLSARELEQVLPAPEAISAMEEVFRLPAGGFEAPIRSRIATVQSAYLVSSAIDGRPVALLEGKYLTGARTAATSAVATRLLAPESPARLALFGTGAQARFHLEAIAAVRQIVEARVVG